MFANSVSGARISEYVVVGRVKKPSVRTAEARLDKDRMAFITRDEETSRLSSGPDDTVPPSFLSQNEEDPFRYVWKILRLNLACEQRDETSALINVRTLM